MKKFFKRKMALLCALVIVISGFDAGNVQVVKADSTDTKQTKTTIYKDKTIASTDVATDGTFTDRSLNVTLGKSSKDKVANLALYVKITTPEGASYDSGSWRIKFSNNINNTGEAYIVPDITSGGVYEHTFLFSEISGVSSLSVSSAIKQCRIYIDDGQTDITGVVINEITIIYTPCEWTVTENQTVTIGEELTANGAGLRLNGIMGDENSLMLYAKMDIPTDVYSGISNINIGLYRTEGSEYQFNITKDSLSEGENIVAIPWTEVTTTGEPSLESELQKCSILAEGTTTGSITVNSIKLVYARPYVKEYQSNSWSIYKNKTISESMRGLTDTSLDIDISEAADSKDNLALYVNMSIPESVFKNAVASNWRIKLSNQNTETLDTYEAIFKPNITSFGEYEAIFLFSETATSKVEKISRLDLTKAIKSCRVYCTTSTGSSIDLKDLVINEIAIVDTTSYVQAGKTPEEQNLSVYDVPKNYLFAGWYTDSACGTANVLEGTADGAVYAKFVRAGVLNMAAQYVEDTEEKTAAVRFVTTVDSLQYQKVGFYITINGTKIPKESTVVYKELYAVGSENNTITYKPTAIDAVSKYFNTYTVSGIPAGSYAMEIKVQSFWVTQDGTEVLGAESTCTVNQLMGISKEV